MPNKQRSPLSNHPETPRDISSRSPVIINAGGENMCVRALNSHYYYLYFIVYVIVSLSLFSPLREIVISRGALARAAFRERVRDIQQHVNSLPALTSLGTAAAAGGLIRNCTPSSVSLWKLYLVQFVRGFLGELTGLEFDSPELELLCEKTVTLWDPAHMLQLALLHTLVDHKQIADTKKTLEDFTVWLRGVGGENFQPSVQEGFAVPEAASERVQKMLVTQSPLQLAGTNL
eukprot:sb/3469384/